jgi:hypothetical protein
VGPLDRAVGGLHRAEQRLLEPVARVLVDVLVRLGEQGERHPDLAGGRGDIVEQLPASVRGRVAHRQPILANRAARPAGPTASRTRT